MSGKPLALELLSETFAICRLPPNSSVPDWAKGDFVSSTQTQNELSIVCSQESVPDDVQTERDWRCLRIVGKLDFSLVGVIASLTGILAEAGISVFVISTYDTDYFLVREKNLVETVEVLENAGYSVENR
ncbi:MAG: ACT domain-containing protein [Planctomycetaceae bacterium]|nr:ACT domain-containing protein [Planctomycetaceae bacterium]